MGVKVYVNIVTKTDLHEIIPFLKKYSANIIELKKSYVTPEFEEMQKLYMLYIDFPTLKQKEKFISKIKRNKNLNII